MTSITETARANPAWSALTSISRLERGQRAVVGPRGHADQRLLWMFCDGRPRTLREIAEELGLEQSTVNRQTNTAFKAGLLERSREPGQNAWHFVASETVLADFARDLDRHLALLNQALEAIAPADRERFLEQFETFASAFAEAASEA